MYGVTTFPRAPRASRLAVAVLALATLSMAGTTAEARSRHSKGHTTHKTEKTSGTAAKSTDAAASNGTIFSALFSGDTDKATTGSLGSNAAADSGVSDSRSAARGAKAQTAARGNGPAGTGIASFYGGSHHGGPTASGERFNQNAMTAAHRSAPLGSQMRVTNLNNGKSIVVRINDRGPYIRGRIIDVSKGAAQALGFISAGLTKVKVEPVT